VAALESVAVVESVAAGAVESVAGAGAGATLSVVALVSSPLLQATTEKDTLNAKRAETKIVFTFFMCFGLRDNITTQF
jgi:hypothetical protein